MAVELGVGYVSVIPSARNFGAQLRKQLGDLSAKVNVTVDNAAVSSLRKQLTGLSTNVGVNIDGSAVNSKLKSQIGNQSALGHQMGTTAGESMASSLTSSAVKAAATIAGILGVTKLLKEGGQVAVDFETTEVAFTGLLGSAELAQAKLKELQEFAKVTPFDFPTLSDASRKLLAFGFDAERIIPTMTTLGNAAAALGVNPREITLVTRALGQIISKGRVQLEELIQIAENFPGADPIPALAASVNASVPDFLKALAEPGGAFQEFGLTGTAAVETILESFKGIKGATGAMERQALTVRGAWTTLADQLRITAIEASKPFMPGISKAIRLTIVPAIENAGNKIKAFASELDGVGKPLVGRFEIMGDAVGRFAKKATKAFKEFRSELDGIGKPTEGTFRKIGDAVGRALNYLDDLPGAFAKAFKTGDLTTDKGLVGLAERVGVAFSDLVDGARAFGKAFITGANDAEKSGFLGFMSDAGEAARDLVDWLQVKIPKAVDALNDAIDKVKPKLDELFQFVRDHKDTILTFAGAIAGLAGSIKVMMELKAVAGIVSGIVGPILSLGPVGLIAAGVAALAGAFVVAYTQYPPFKEAIDGIITAFKDEGFAGGVRKIGDELGNLFGKVDELWEKAKPVLAEFFQKAKKYVQDGLMDLFNFGVITPDASIDFPGAAFAAPAAAPLPASIDFPGTSFVSPPSPKQFKSFGEGFADAMMTQVVPAIGDWIVTNKQKIFDQFNKLLKVIGEWADKNGPKIATTVAGSIIKGFGKIEAKNIEMEAKALLKLDISISPASNLFQALRDFSKENGPGIDRELGGAVLFNISPFGALVGWLREIGPSVDNAAEKIAGFVASSGAWLVVVSPFAAVVGWLREIGPSVDNAVEKFAGFVASSGAWMVIASPFITLVKWLREIGPSVDNAVAKILDFVSKSGGWFVIASPFLVLVAAIKEIAPALEGATTAIKKFVDKLGGWMLVISPFAALFSKLGGGGGGNGEENSGEGRSVPSISENAKGNVFTRDFTGLMRFAETPKARPEIVSPVALMAETFRRELADAPSNGRGVLIDTINVTEAQSAAAVVDEIHARLGWMLTTRAER